MKKSRLFFAITSLLWGAAAIAAICVFPKLWYIWGVVGIAVWCVYAACFHAISYELSDGVLKIKSGVFFKRERIIRLSDILMTTQLRAADRVLFTAAVFSGGRVVVFAELPISM